MCVCVQGRRFITTNPTRTAATKPHCTPKSQPNEQRAGRKTHEAGGEIVLVALDGLREGLVAVAVGEVEGLPPPPLVEERRQVCYCARTSRGGVWMGGDWWGVCLEWVRITMDPA